MRSIAAKFATATRLSRYPLQLLSGQLPANRGNRLLLISAAVLLVGCATPATDSHAPPSKPHLQTIDTRAQHCVALAMYWEARGEGHRGMLAVGSVILNRVADERFPNSACAVVFEGGETPPCQFSWWCDGKSDRPTHAGLWASAQSVAAQLLTERPADPTHGALFFHNTSIRKPWRREKTAHIGNHIFYR